MEKVVVIGGGISGLETGLRVERKGFEVKIIEPKDKMVFYPSVHRLLEGESENSFTIDYDSKFKGRNIEHVDQKASRIDFDQKNVVTETQELNYDYLVLATGSETKFYNIPGHEKAKTMRFKEDPKEIFQAINDGAIDHITVVGGGATGVEAVSSLLELRKEMNFSVRLVHGGDRLLPSCNGELSESVEESLDSREVEIELGNRVVEIRDESVILDSGKDLETDLVLWAGGVKPNEFIENIDIEQNERGIEVDKYMQAEKENVFAVGDNCSYEGKSSRALYGIFEAQTAAENITRISEGKTLEERNIKWDPEIIYLGKGDSALEFGDICFRGLIPSLIRTIGVERRYLLLRKHWL